MTPPKQVLQLIERFERNLSEYKRPDYKEARVRAEFIDPVLEALGWDAAGGCAMVVEGYNWGGTLFLMGLRAGFHPFSSQGAYSAGQAYYHNRMNGDMINAQNLF